MRRKPVMQRDLSTMGKSSRLGKRPLRAVFLLLAACGLTGAALPVLLNPERPAAAPATPPSTPLNTRPTTPLGKASGRVSIPLEIPAVHPPTASFQPSAAPDAPPWVKHIIRSGDTLSGIFSDLGLSAKELHEILELGGPTQSLSRITPGHVLKIQRSAAGHLAALRYELHALEELHIQRNGDRFQAQIQQPEIERRPAHASATIESSLFLAAQKAGLSDDLTMELADIFGWDIDFALDIRTGDEFTVVYEELYRNGEKVDNGPILSAEFVNRGRTYRSVRFDNPASDRAAYYTPEGQSMRKPFLRTPVKFSRISSGFNLRRKHPILNTIRAHKGVDYAAPTGTPIRATGDGQIVDKGRKGGYGRTIIIQHGNGYSTLYAHMSRYARGPKKGRQVRQGQVIGYVGRSGRATGPHLHYEFRVNGAHRNPLTVTLPKAAPIQAKYREAFLAQTQPLLAQLALVRRVMVAARP